MQPPSCFLGWLPKVVQAPGPWTLTCLSACRSCHLAATSAKGSAHRSPPPPPPPPPQKLVQAGTREMTQGPSRPFSSCHWALAWMQQKSERVLAGRGSSVHTGRSSRGVSLRVKGKARACEGREQPSESPGLAWGKEDKLPLRGAPCSRRILTTVSALGQSAVSPV